MKVAYVSPLPPERSGIADYSALLLPSLRQKFDVHVVGRGQRSPTNADVVLYHIGNDPTSHGWIYEQLRTRPGLVVLHEFVLHHLVAGITLGRGDGQAYLRALQRGHGVAGRLLGHGVIDGSLPPLWEIAPERFPLVDEVLDLATGLIVHSRYVEGLVRERGYSRPLWRIPHPAWPAVGRPRTDLFPGRFPVIGSFGHINARKRVSVLLEAFSLLRRDHPRAVLVLAGSIANRVELDARLRERDLVAGEHVVHEGHVPEARLWDLLGGSDICVNLRYPTMGETSGIALRALSLGKPLVVNDVGWFSELPGAVAAKVEVGPRQVEVLAAFLSHLAADPSLRERMGEAARAYVAREHGLDMVAEGYAVASEEAAGGSAVRDAALLDVAVAAHDVGLETNDAELISVAARVRELGLR